jgi:hypothetical protein
LASTLPEERVKISWVTIDRICQEEADSKENVRRELVRNGGGNPAKLVASCPSRAAAPCAAHSPTLDRAIEIICRGLAPAR